MPDTQQTANDIELLLYKGRTNVVSLEKNASATMVLVMGSSLSFLEISCSRYQSIRMTFPKALPKFVIDLSASKASDWYCMSRLSVVSAHLQ